MKHYGTLAILFLLIALYCVTAIASERPENPGDVDQELWSQLVAIDERSRAIEDFAADYVEKKHSLLLKKPLVSQGHVIAKSPIVRWDLREPYEQTTIVSPGTIKVYYPTEKLLEVYALGDRIADLSTSPVPSLARTVELFEITRAAEQDSASTGEKHSSEVKHSDAAERETLTLKLTPRDEKLRENLAGVVVTIDVTEGYASRMIMLQESGENTEIQFQKVRVNQGIDESRLQLQVPDDVQIVKPLEAQKEGG